MLSERSSRARTLHSSDLVARSNYEMGGRERKREGGSMGEGGIVRDNLFTN